MDAFGGMPSRPRPPDPDATEADEYLLPQPLDSHGSLAAIRWIQAYWSFDSMAADGDSDPPSAPDEKAEGKFCFIPKIK